MPYSPESFLQNIPPPGIMDGPLPGDRSYAHSAQWQDMELTFGGLFTTQKQAREKVAYACLRPAEVFMRACLRPT